VTGVLAIAGLVVLLGCGSKTDPAAVKREGRLEIVYAIDLEVAIVDKASDLQRDLEALLAASKITGSVTQPISPVGAITVLLADPVHRPEIEGALKADYRDTVEQRACDPADQAGAICLRVSASYAAALRKAALQAAVATIRARLEATNVANPTVLAKGETIVIEHDSDGLAARELVARTGKLELKAVDDGSSYMMKLYAHVGDEGGRATDPAAVAAEIAAEVEVWRDDAGRSHQDYYLTARDREDDVPVAEAAALGCRTPPRAPNDQATVRCSIAGHVAITRYVSVLARRDPSFVLPTDRQLAYERVLPGRHVKDSRPYWRSHYLERRSELTGRSISNATSSRDPNTSQAIVLLDFNRHGTQLLADVTARLVGKKLAFVLDGTVKSAPIINGAIRGGRASITMGGMDPAAQEREAHELVTVLKAGSLPAPLRELSRRRW